MAIETIAEATIDLSVIDVVDTENVLNQAKEYTDTAKADAITIASADATAKAEQAKKDAINTASSDATTKVDAAKTETLQKATEMVETKADKDLSNVSPTVLKTLSNTNVYYQATDPWADVYNQFIASGKTEAEAEELADAKFTDGDLWYQTLVEAEYDTDDTTAIDTTALDLPTSSSSSSTESSTETTDTDSSTDTEAEEEKQNQQLNIPYIHRWKSAYQTTDEDGNTVTIDANWELVQEAQNYIIAGSITAQEIATNTITADNIVGGSLTLEEMDTSFNEAWNQLNADDLIASGWAELTSNGLIVGKNEITTTDSEGATQTVEGSQMKLSADGLYFSHGDDNVAWIDASSAESLLAIRRSKQSTILMRTALEQSESKGNLGLVAQTNGHVSLKEVSD